MKPAANNVYDGHAQQKLVTPHIQDRSTPLKKKINESTNQKEK